MVARREQAQPQTVPEPRLVAFPPPRILAARLGDRAEAELGRQIIRAVVQSGVVAVALAHGCLVISGMLVRAVSTAEAAAEPDAESIPPGNRLAELPAARQGVMKAGIMLETTLVHPPGAILTQARTAPRGWTLAPRTRRGAVAAVAAPETRAPATRAVLVGFPLVAVAAVERPAALAVLAVPAATAES